MKILLKCVILIIATTQFSISQDDTPTFFNHSSAHPKSFDPLNADLLSNLHFMRLLYLTPIELDHNDNFRSTILKKFSYDESKKVLEFIVNEEVRYSDGTKISVNDVVLTVKRMMLNRPKFPLIKHILGKKKWLKLKNPLEHDVEGIKIESQKVRIQFKNKVINPLYFLSLELFSIIPSRCVDLKTSNMICSVPSFSGHYKIKLKNRKFYELIKMRKGDSIFEYKVPLKIRYIINDANNKDKLKKYSNRNDVILSLDFLVDDQTRKHFGDDKILELPNNRIVYLLLNSQINPFNDKECRQAFSNIVSNIIRQNEMNIGKPSRSFFNEILPGFIGNDLKVKIGEDAYQRAINKIRNSQLTWMIKPTSIDYPFVSKLVKKLSEIGIKIKLIAKDATYKNSVDKLINGKNSMKLSTTGFWPHEPSGDVEMHFTPKLHKILNHVTSDANVQEIVNELVRSKTRNSYVKLNEYLLNDSKLIMISHLRNVYIFNKKQKKLNVSVRDYVVPVWQLFDG